MTAETGPRGPLSRQLAWLRQEAARWRADGLISAEQEQAILARYPAGEQGDSQIRTIAVFTILGAILLGLGVILFLAHNWYEIPRWVRLAAIFAVLVASHAPGYWLWRVRESYPRVGHALVLLGNLLYGAGIWLVAQIYHIRAHWPNGVLLWAVGTLPVAYALDSRPSLALATLLLGLWTAFEQAGFQSGNWLFPVLLLGVAWPLAYRLRSAESLALGLLGAAFWSGFNAGQWAMHANERAGMLALAAVATVGVAAFAAGLWHLARAAGGQDRWREMAWPYLLGGALLALLGTYGLSFRWTPNAQDWPDNYRSGILIAVLALAGLTALLATVRLALPARRSGAGEGAGTLIWAAAGAAVFLAGGLLPLVTDPLPRVVAANLLLLVGIAGLVAWGLREENAAAVNLGLGFFVLTVFTRYFDLFWTLLDRSLFFVVGGALLLGGGTLLERSRRRWLGQMKGVGGHAG